MYKEIKNAIIKEMNNIPEWYKYSIALNITTELYKMLPVWKEAQERCHMQALENLMDFIETLEEGRR